MSGAPPDRVMEGWMSLRDVLADAQRRLTAAGVPSPESDASQLAAHVLGVPRNRLILQDRMPPEQRTAFELLLSRRLARVPLQHLLGTAPFRYLELEVGPGVFVPRPETELVAGVAVQELRALPPEERLAVDLCTGSGAIALALATEVASTRVYAIEVDDAAIAWARRNGAAFVDAITAQGSAIEIVQADATECGDEGQPLDDIAGSVAVVTANPPYVPVGARVRDPEVREHDPALALYGGVDGLDVVRGVARTAARLLRPGGLVVIEHSDEQGGPLSAAQPPGSAGVPALLMGDPAWTDVQDHLDLARKPRYTTARRSPLSPAASTLSGADSVG